MSRYALAEKNDRYYATVASYGSAQSDTVIPDGEKWKIVRFTASAAQVSGTVVKLIWDSAGTPVIIMATHGDVNALLEFEAEGNGIKKLTILLENETGAEETIGGQWEAQEVA